MSAVETLCREPVHQDSIGEPWGFKAVCSVCYPLRDFIEAEWEPQPIRGREKWPNSSDEIQELSPEEIDQLLTPPSEAEQAEPSSPDQT